MNKNSPTKISIIKDLRQKGLGIAYKAFNQLSRDGLFSMEKSPDGQTFIPSREEAEKVKRVIWVYYRGTEPYPDDIDGK
ncbi:MAG: hypothetical protein V3U97_04740 [bacterium]